MNWLRRNAEPLEAIAALITAMVALAALIAIPLQIRANAALQAEQSARDIYREFVALSVNKPNLAAPDYCVLKEDADTLTAYSFYMEYLLYTAEQVTDISVEWEPVMQGHLSQHDAFICDNLDWHGDTGPVAALIVRQRAQCVTEPSC